MNKQTERYYLQTQTYITKNSNIEYIKNSQNPTIKK